MAVGRERAQAQLFGRGEGLAVVVGGGLALWGRLAWRALVPFVVTSIPAAFIGGLLVLPAYLYKPLVGVVLIVAAVQLFRRARRAAEADQPPTECTTPDPAKSA